MFNYSTTKINTKNRFGRLCLGIFAVLALLLSISSAAFCYELNGTATGNILQDGYHAESAEFSAAADIENGYVLTVTQNGKTFIADADNSSYLNICNNTIYYITVNADADKTELRSYDIKTGKAAVVYSVPVIEGMMYLYVIDNQAYFQSNGNILCFDLNQKTVTEVLTGVSAFLPVNNTFLYTKGTDLYYGNTKIAENCFYFDCDTDTVYYSNGEDGIYAQSLDNGKAKRIGNGGTSLVAADSVLYWQYRDMVLTYEKNKVSFEQAVDSETTSLEILPETGVAPVEEEIGEGGAADSSTGLTLTDTASLGMPAGDYKNWKQFDSRWGDIHLGSSDYTIRSSGCAATSVAILLVGSGETAARYLNGDFNPGIFVTEMSNNGGFTGSGGIYWSKVGNLYTTFQYDHDNKSFSSRTLAEQCSDINSNMANHNYLVLQVKTSGTHFVAADYAADNTIYVCDPGKSSSNTLAPYNAGNIGYRAVVFHYSGNNSNWGGGNSSNNGSSDQGQTTTKETVSTPVISVSNNKVTITCATEGATIYYTTNGNTPTANSTKYTAAFTLSSSATIKAIAVKSGWNSSSVTQKAFSYIKSPFKDVDTADWSFDCILRAYEADLIEGVGNNYFSPNANATRAQFVTIISRINDQEMMEYDSEFEDLEADWYIDAVNWAFRNGITNGVDDTHFSPDSNITREQACTLLVRMANYLNEKEIDTGSLLQPTKAKITFKDSAKISPYAKDAVSLAQQAGLINGVNTANGTYFYPQDNATRAEIAAMIIRMVEGMDD